MTTFRAPPGQLVCSAVPSGWAAITTWFSVAGAVSGEQHPMVLLTGAAASTAAVAAALLLARSMWAVGLALLAAAGLGPGGGPVTAVGLTAAAGLVCLMVVLLEPPGLLPPSSEKRR